MCSSLHTTFLQINAHKHTFTYILTYGDMFRIYRSIFRPPAKFTNCVMVTVLRFFYLFHYYDVNTQCIYSCCLLNRNFKAFYSFKCMNNLKKWYEDAGWIKLAQDSAKWRLLWAQWPTLWSHTLRWEITWPPEQILILDGRIMLLLTLSGR